MKFENSCILCNSNDYYVIADEAYPFAKRIKNIICTGCGLTRIEPMPRLDDMRKHYENYRENTINLKTPTPEYEANALINAKYHYSFFSDLLEKQSTILDVGCGAGTLLYCAVLDGHLAYGVNPDAGFGNYGVDNYKIKEVKISLFEEAEFEEMKFDIITFNHVFEHFIEPHETLKKIKYLLKDEGLIYLSIPDSLKPHGQLEYNYFDEHIYTYTLKNITDLLKMHGFEIIRYSDYGVKLTDGLHHPWIDLVARLKNRFVEKSFIPQDEKYAGNVMNSLSRYKLEYSNRYGLMSLKLGILRVKLERMVDQSNFLKALLIRVILKAIKGLAHIERDYCGPSISQTFPKEKIIEVKK